MKYLGISLCFDLGIHISFLAVELPAHICCVFFYFPFEDFRCILAVLLLMRWMNAISMTEKLLRVNLKYIVINV